MRRQLKVHMKIGIVIFIFSLIVTVIFTGVLMWYGTQTIWRDKEKGSAYFLTSTDYKELIESDGVLHIDGRKLVEISDYNNTLLKNNFQKLLPVSLIFMVAFFSMSLFLWFVLGRIQRDQTIKIASQLGNVMDGHISAEDPELLAAYIDLKQVFVNQLGDYKRLSAYLSHEQKNAISILRTNLELSDNREYLKNLDDITDSIDDILTLSETIDISPITVVDVSLVCAEIYDNYRKTAKNINFDFNGDDDTEILAKNRWVYRAIANLLDNAIKYGEGKPILLSVKAKHNSVIVSVTDHGIGIEEAKQEKIFHDRYRINELNKNGYGIGLSLVSHVCDLCGGFVTVDSVLGEGSTFYLSFPQKLF